MSSNSHLRAVIDTNIIFEGLTKQGGIMGGIIEAWLGDQFLPYVSNSVAYEYVDVLSRKLSSQRWQQIRPVLGVLLKKAYYVGIYYSWRPISPDPGDDHIINCAMNANAIIVTSNIRDFTKAKDMLGATIMSPLTFAAELAK